MGNFMQIFNTVKCAYSIETSFDSPVNMNGHSNVAYQNLS
jgi:hypothetical protein